MVGHSGPAAGEESGFFVSTDRGESWTKRSDYIVVDPQYYGEIYPDPHRPGRIYAVDVWIHVTDDDGHTWRRVNSRFKHVDNHEIVFDPDDPDYLMVGTDGGLYESFDGSRTWRFVANLPLTQFYRVGIDDLEPSLTPVELTATVHDLATARSGIYHVAAYEPSSMRTNRPPRGSQTPGEFWFYNNWDYNALATIHEIATGTDVFSAFETEVARPLQMEDYSLEGQEWVGHPETLHPAYVFRMSARDIARVGLLMLRGGTWRGEQIVSPEWVELSTSAIVPEVWWGSGYGYMWWASVSGRHYPGVSLPEGAFVGRGPDRTTYWSCRLWTWSSFTRPRRTAPRQEGG